MTIDNDFKTSATTILCYEMKMYFKYNNWINFFSSITVWHVLFDAMLCVARLINIDI